MTNYSLRDLDLYGGGLAYYSEISGANTLEYFCTPRNPEALLTEKAWKIMRLETVTLTGNMAPGKCIKWAN